jgi:L-alanine-DL-glutamate epimerase-like enolase superfamily enzyme
MKIAVTDICIATPVGATSPFSRSPLTTAWSAGRNTTKATVAGHRRDPSHGPSLIGQDPRDRAYHDDLHAITRQAPGGINQQAMAAIENALSTLRPSARHSGLRPAVRA